MVALRLAMSEADLYRKQRIAIEQVAHKVAEMEQIHPENPVTASNEAADMLPTESPVVPSAK